MIGSRRLVPAAPLLVCVPGHSLVIPSLLSLPALFRFSCGSFRNCRRLGLGFWLSFRLSGGRGRFRLHLLSSGGRISTCYADAAFPRGFKIVLCNIVVD